MNLPAAVLLFALLPVLFGVIVRLALAAGRAGLPGWAWLPIIVLTIPALLAGGAYFVAHAGERTVGIVSGKSESLEIADIGLNPSVSHRLVLTVEDDAAPPDVVRIGHEAVVARRGNLEFDVDEALFDACRPGQRIALRRLRLGPLEFARLESEPWWDVAPGWFERVWPVADARAPRYTTAAQVVAARAVRDAYAASLVNGGGDGGAYSYRP